MGMAPICGYGRRREPKKRNMDLIRDILLFAEAQSKSWFASNIQIGDGPAEETIYNVGLCFDAGFFHGEDNATIGGAGGPDWLITRMTYAGHEFLDSIRNDTVWSKVKTRAKEQGVDLTVDLTILLAKQALAALFPPGDAP